MSSIYNIAKAAWLGNHGNVSETMDWDSASSDTYEVALIDNEGGTPYSFDSTHNYVSEVFDGGTTGLEFSGSNYTRQTLGSKTVTQDDGNTRGEADAADATFTGIDGATIAAALVFKVGPTDDTDSPLVAHITSADFPLTANGGDVTISWDAEGIVHIT